MVIHTEIKEPPFLYRIVDSLGNITLDSFDDEACAMTHHIETYGEYEPVLEQLDDCLDEIETFDNMARWKWHKGAKVYSEVFGIKHWEQVDVIKEAQEELLDLKNFMARLWWKLERLRTITDDLYYVDIGDGDSIFIRAKDERDVRRQIDEIGEFSSDMVNYILKVPIDQLYSVSV